MEHSFLQKIFALLSENLAFPYYQGERRIGIFINIFLEDLVRQHTRFKKAQYILPEFPLRKNDLTDHAAHIDYLMYDEEANTALLVELKTDDRSFLDGQIRFYLEHPQFSILYDKCCSIKMKGFPEKRKKLMDALSHIPKDSTLAVVVLKPSVSAIDTEMADEFKGRLHFISLAEADIDTEYKQEWVLLRDNVLSKLNKKNKIKLT